MSFSEHFIKRPVGTSLLALGLFACGAAAFLLMPVAPVPRVDYPVIVVSASLPGANPETVASSLATPLERRLGQIAGVSEMTSVSTLGGCAVALQFDLNRKIDAAAHDVQAAINASVNDLPINLPNLPTYRKVNPADAPVMLIALTSESLPQSELFEFADEILGQKLNQIEGVSQVGINGAEKFAVRVRMNPSALASANLNMEDIRALLAESNVNLPAGSVDGPETTQAISVNGQLVEPAPYQKLIIAQKNGVALRLNAFGEAVEGVENNRLAGWDGDKPAVVVVIQKQAGANVIETVDRIKAAIPQLERWMPAGIKLNILNDRTKTIRASVQDVELTVIISFALVAMVSLLFLRRLWPTLIANATVPLSLSGAIGLMYLCNYSIDNLSLMAITVSVGFVVDDAIVVIENIQRLIEGGKRPMEAALEGARQIGFTVVSMSLSLIAAFIPLIFMGGLVGRLFHEFAVTVALAIMVSGAVSLTLTPTLCSRFLRAEADYPPPGLFNRTCERGFQALLSWYKTALKWALRNQTAMLTIALSTLALTIWLYCETPKGFFPQQDTGSITGTTEAAQDISSAAMAKLQRKMALIVLADPAVESVDSFIGSSSGGSSGNNGRMFIALKPLSQRDATADQIVNRLRKKTSQVVGMTLYLQAAQDIRVGGRSSKAQFQYTLQSNSLPDLAEWTKKLMAKLNESPKLKDVNTDQQMRGLQMNVAVDRDAASRLGVEMSSIDNALYDCFGQRQASIIYAPYNQHHVILEASPELQLEPASLGKIYVKANSGAEVPLSSVASFEPANTSLAVNHQGEFPAITVSFNLAPGVALGDATGIVRKATEELRLPANVKGSFQGTAKQFQASMSNMPLLIGAALVAIYVVLGMLYESLIHPLTIISTLPSAGVGALLALTASGNDLSLVSFIGIILLMGIVKKNAIMMIDFALDAERRLGLPPAEAVYRACVIRFRPIMMTTMAALLGAVPLAIGMGTGSELRKPLGIAIVGGLLLSQTLTLLTTPVVYLAIERARLKVAEWKRRGSAIESEPKAPAATLSRQS